MTMTATSKQSQSEHDNPSVSIVNTNRVKKILLVDGWHEVQGAARIVPYSVGSSPQTSYRTAIRFTDKNTGEEMIVDKSACLAFIGGFSN